MNRAHSVPVGGKRQKSPNQPSPGVTPIEIQSAALLLEQQMADHTRA